MNQMTKYKTLLLKNNLEITTRDELRASLNIAEQYLGYVYYKLQRFMETTDRAIIVEKAMLASYQIGTTIQQMNEIRKIYCKHCLINGNCCNTCGRTRHYYAKAKDALARCDDITSDYWEIVNISRGEMDRNIISVQVTSED